MGKSTRYCYGLPFFERRPLQPEERQKLLEVFNRVNRVRERWQWILMLSIPGFLVGMAASLEINLNFFLPFLMGLLLTLGVVSLRWYDAKLQVKQGKRALDIPLVEVFEGPASYLIDCPLPIFFNPERGEDDENYRVTFIRMPTTGEILAINDIFFLTGRVKAETATVAARQAPARPAFPSAASLQHDKLYKTRDLSVDEREEILRLAKAGRPKMKVGRALLMLYLLAVVIFGLGPWEHSAIMVLRSLLVGTVLFFALKDQVQDWMLCSRLRRDAASGEVISVEQQGTLIEVLPVSHRIWTVEGKPHEWRFTRTTE